MSMNKVRNKFLLYAMLSIFTLITLMLTIINGVNFTMASSDADMLTQILSEKHGAFADQGSRSQKGQKSSTADTPEKQSSNNSGAQSAMPGNAPQSDTQAPPQNGSQSGNYKRLGPMGPSSPEMNNSLRYFTYSFNDKGKSEKISFRISAVTEEEAEEWARSLSDAVNKTGWTHGTYRYRVYTEGKKTYVTIIDQGRELLPSYRILIISVCGEIIGLIISFFVLMLNSKRLFKPLEEADRKQKSFIKNIESEFKLPLTVINADTEVIERELGSNDYTKSINRQVKKMTALVKDIGSLAIFEENDKAVTKVNLSSTLSYVLDFNRPIFKEKDISLETDIEEDIIINAEDEAIKRLFSELVDNSLKYSLTKASFTLHREGDRILLIQSNDAKLPSGMADQVFDRFTTLENAEGTQAVGLGLSYVKDIVKAQNGRVSAKVSDGVFTLTLAV